jgi:DNA polymerase alpha-associated DNA helicase A
MHAQICEFPSNTLYSSKLISHDSVVSHLLRDLPDVKPESEEDEKEVLGTPVIFFDTAGCEYYERLEGDGDEGSRCNENEATVVKNWIENLVRNCILVRYTRLSGCRTGRQWCLLFTNCCDHTVG